MLWRYILPAILGPVFRHSMLRIPGVALALAALGFLGLGPHQPTPEWGLVLAEGINYVERAPWAVAAPASALVLASVLAVSLSSVTWWRPPRNNRPTLRLTPLRWPGTARPERESRV
jgi:peptide/nickel transport system permease protein